MSKFAYLVIDPNSLFSESGTPGSVALVPLPCRTVSTGAADKGVLVKYFTMSNNGALVKYFTYVNDICY